MNNLAPFANGPGMDCCTPNYDSTVDQLLGNAYQVVKFVAMRMPFIKTVSDNIDSVIAIATALDQLKALEEKLPELLELRAKLAELMQLYEHLNELLLISSNMPQLLTVYDNLANIQTIVDHLAQIQMVATNIQSIVTVSTNIQAVLNVNNNMSAVLNVNTNMSSVTNVSTNMTDVRKVSTEMVSVKNVSDNMAEILAVYAKLPDLTNINNNLNAALADNATFKSANGSNSIGHTPATGVATTVGAALKALRTDVDGKAATGASYTKSESDAKYPLKTDVPTKTEQATALAQKADKSAVLGGGGDPVDQKTSRAYNTWYTAPDRPMNVLITAICTAADVVRIVADIRKDSASPVVTAMANQTPSMTIGGVIGESFMVPPGWQYRVVVTNADTIHQWIEY